MKYLAFLKKDLFKETFIYTITDVVGKAMSFLLLPFISYYLPPAELGVATNFTVLTNIVILLAGLAVVNSLPYFFYEQGRRENNLLVSNLFILCTLLCSCLSVVILLLNDFVEKYLQLGVEIQLLSVLFVYGSLISQMNLLLLRLENKPRQFAYLQIAQIMLHAIAVVFFVIVLKGGGIGKIYAEVIVFIFVGLIHLLIMIKKGYLIPKLEIKWINKLLKFGLPLLPHSISFWLKGGTDKIFITTFCGLQLNGLYSMAMSISSLYTMLTHSFFNAYTPYLQKRIAAINDVNETDEKRKIVKQIYGIYLVFFFLGLLAIAGSWIIFQFIIDLKYLPAFEYMPYIVLAYFIYTFYNFAIQFIYKMKKTFVMGIITFTGSVVQMLLAYWMIQKFGVMGAVYSLLIGNVLITFGIWIYSNKVYKMPWLIV